jgi:esterase/lipase superfamily enzyme
VEYHDALALVIGILEEMLGSKIYADMRLDGLISAKSEIIDALRQAVKIRAGISIGAKDIRDCETVGRLAECLAQIATRDSSNRARLWESKGDETKIDACEYPVWFGTNRQPNKTANGSLEFSSVRDSVVHLGLCRVSVPKSHKIGSLGSPLWKRITTGIDDRLRLVSIEEMAIDEYWRAVTEAVGAVDIDERDAVIFVHGYNVSFADAALRAAQIGFDLSITGAMMFFSWPSMGATSAYMADEATIEASEAAITQFMTDVATQAGARAVHIIAHSMGNRGVLRAISRIAANAEQLSRVRFEQIILAAPDIDLDLFRQSCGAYARVSKRTTLYVCAKDRAIEASGWLHQFPRVGLTPPICVMSGIDTVNVTNVDLTILGHGYVAEAREVLHDMHDLITHGTEPDRRFGLRGYVTESGGRFWIVGA